MGALKEYHQKRSDSISSSTDTFRLRVSPEAVIIVTKTNRIVLSGSSSWGREEFNQKELLEIQVPEGFLSAKPLDATTPRTPTDLPVELTLRKVNSKAEYFGVSSENKSPGTARSPEPAFECALTRSAEDAIIATAPDGTVLSWNAGAQRLYGYEAAEMIGKPIAMLIPYEHRANEQRIQEKVCAGEHIPSYETSRSRKDGVALDVMITLSPIRNAGREVVGTSEIARDIRTRLAVERELSSQIAALTESNQELQDYALVVAHDLQAPLKTVARFFAEISPELMNQSDPEAMDRLTTAHDDARRMQRLIKDLLELARLGGQEGHFVNTDCSATMAEVLSNLDAVIRESGALVSLEPMPTIYADPTQIGQVFQNLIANAIKFHGNTPPEVRVGAEMRAREWRFSVSDNGIGIDPSLLPKLFQPLQRLNRSDSIEGSGLGLAIARKIVTRHGGRIWADSKVGIGSTFYFTIPAVNEDNRGERQPWAAVDKASTSDH